LGWLFPFFLTRWKDRDIERLKRGGCYEREKQRVKGRQEGAADEPQREEKDEEGEEEQVSWQGKIAAVDGGCVRFFPSADDDLILACAPDER